MSQGHFIRPFNTNYRDPTEKRLEETIDETPYKFKVRSQEQYVKKPKVSAVMPSVPVIQQQPAQLAMQQSFVHQPVREQCSMNCFLRKIFPCCFPQQFPIQPQPLTSPNQLGTSPSTSNLQATGNNTYKVGNCCCRIFQPQLCYECVMKICHNCRNSMCLKFRMCSNCKSLMCPKCRENLCCAGRIKLRNYPIRLKNKNGLHFENCSCGQCLLFAEEAKKQLQIRMNPATISTIQAQTQNNMQAMGQNPNMVNSTVNSYQLPINANMGNMGNIGSMGSMNNVGTKNMGSMNMGNIGNMGMGQMNKMGSLNSSIGSSIAMDGLGGMQGNPGTYMMNSTNSLYH